MPRKDEDKEAHCWPCQRHASEHVQLGFPPKRLPIPVQAMFWENILAAELQGVWLYSYSDLEVPTPTTHYRLGLTSTFTAVPSADAPSLNGCLGFTLGHPVATMAVMRAPCVTSDMFVDKGWVLTYYR